MNGSMQKKIRPVSLISGKQAFLAGLDWKNIPPGYRNARRCARSQGAELYLSCHNHDGENGDEMMIALLSRQDADIPRNIRQCLSLAMLIRPLLKSGGYAIFIIGNDENDDAELTCAFVSVINGILVNDVTGTPTESTEARNTFLMLNADIVFDRETLYEKVWGMDAIGDNATVAVHINRLREKLEKEPAKPRYIETVWGAGYRFRG